MRDFEQSIIINEKIKLEERFEFRTIFSEEAVQAASVERVCFPPNEACTEEMMKRRALKIRELFFVAVDRKSGEVAGFLNGLATDGDCLKDEFFRNADLHDPTGDNVMILGLAVLPKYRGIGVASELMRRYSGIRSASSMKIWKISGTGSYTMNPAGAARFPAAIVCLP